MTKPDVTAADVMRAARRAAMTMATDPECQHYSPDTMALVLGQVVRNLAGAGTLYNAAKLIAEDPKLAAVPFPVVEALTAASFKHFALALGKAS